VAHDGDVFPSGFLPLAAGNVRDHGFNEPSIDSYLGLYQPAFPR
jgi:MoaA/NifB/PqqE/SkfB family radical SAM enzyme